MKLLVSFTSGMLFSLGLILSGMVYPEKVLGFLSVLRPQQFDPSLIFVMGGAVIFNMVSFYLIKKGKGPSFREEIFWPLKKHIDKKLIIGAVLFGVGWGITGICPGPALLTLFSLQKPAFLFVAFMLLGLFLNKHVVK